MSDGMDWEAVLGCRRVECMDVKLQMYNMTGYPFMHASSTYM